MSDLPQLAILLLTCKRTDTALRTINSTFKNLRYPQDRIGIYVADDGSPIEHHQKLMQEIVVEHNIHVIGHHNEKMRRPGEENTYNAGLGWNRGLGLCHQFSDYVLVLEDDWELDEPLELKPYIHLLQNNDSVGICSFRILSAGADVHTVGYNGEMFLQYHRSTQYSYSGNPHIRHARFTKHYGWFKEDLSPGEIELKQDDVYRLDVQGGPFIWRPVNISVWGSWKHIGQQKTWE